jgi:hypothetical protein
MRVFSHEEYLSLESRSLAAHEGVDFASGDGGT